MSLAHKYEEFGQQIVFTPETFGQDQSNLESEKLQSFEDGYEAGWEDSVTAQDKSRNEISADFAKKLKEISLTFEDAQISLTHGLLPLFEDIVEKFLPEIAKVTLGPHIAGQLSELVQSQSDQEIEIIVSPNDYGSVKDLMESLIFDPFVILTKPELEDGQVYLKVGTKLREINFDKMIRKIQESTSNLFEQETVHG
jgi:flagellar assembly protein FliH